MKNSGVQILFVLALCFSLSSGFLKVVLPENYDLKGNLTNLYIGDFDGDGRSDFLRQEKDAWDDDRINSANVFISACRHSFKKITLPEEDDLSGDYTNLYIGDFDGDGRDDVLRQEKGPWDDDRFNTANVFLSLGKGNFQKIVLSEDLDLKGDSSNLYIGDFNGDGMDDILRQEKGAWDNDQFNTANVLLSLGKGSFKKIVLPEDLDLKGDLTNLYIGDFNGDGMDDILRQEKGIWANDRYNTANVLISTGQGTFQKVDLPEDFDLNGDLTNLYIGDFNGDGMADILRQEKGIWANDRYNTANVLLSTFSTGEETFQKVVLPEDFNLNGDFTNLYIGDFNGDGMDDILRQEKEQWDDDRFNTANILFSTGAGTFKKIVLPERLDLSGELTNLYIGDFNGDGKDDILRQEKGAWDDDAINTANLILSQ